MRYFARTQFWKSEKHLIMNIPYYLSDYEKNGDS